MSLWNANDSKRGYDEGYNDARNGKEPDFSNCGASAKYVIHGNFAAETYNSAYKDGYSDGSRDRSRAEYNRRNNDDRRD